MAKICDMKKLKNNSMANEKLSVTNYQSPKDVLRPLGLERPD